MADVVELNDLRSLSRYRLLWDSLVADTPDATFLHTYDWLEDYWRHFGTGKQLRVLVVRSAGHGVGILPLCIVRRKLRLGSLRVLTYPLDDWATFYGPIGPSPTATLFTAMRHVATSPCDWDQIDLPGIANHGRTTLAMQQVGFTPRIEPQDGTSVIDLTGVGSWDSYLARLPHQSRSALERTIEQLNERDDAEFIRHRPEPRRSGDGDPAWDFYDQCEQLALKVWQHTSNKSNAIWHPSLVSFFRDTHAAASRLGMVDMAVLKLAGQPVAYWYGYHFAGRLMGLRMACTPESPVSDVRMALMSRLIEDSLDRGDEMLDLWSGDETYRAELGTSVVRRYRVSYTPRTAIRPQLIRAGRWLRRRTASPLRLAAAN